MGSPIARSAFEGSNMLVDRDVLQFPQARRFYLYFIAVCNINSSCYLLSTLRRASLHLHVSLNGLSYTGKAVNGGKRLSWV